MAADTTNVPERVPQAPAWYGRPRMTTAITRYDHARKWGCRSRATDLPARARVPLSQGEAGVTEISVAARETLARLRGDFPDERSCGAYLFERRWPNGFACPNCGFGRYAALKTRAHTYECRDCRLQTSITAGTVMHRSKLPLTVWFGAIQLVMTRSDDISAEELKTSLGIKKNSARLLKQKLDRLISSNCERLEGAVAVLHLEVQYHTEYRLIIIGALELSSGHIRLAAVSDDSAGSIESAVQENVRRGTTLLTNSPRYRGFTNYNVESIGVGARSQQIQQILSRVETWVKQYGRLPREQINGHLQQYVVLHNRGRPRRQASFEAMIDLVLGHGPVSYWQMLGRDNPRKGVPTVRRNPRRRKTANGMREDGSGRVQNLDPVQPRARNILIGTAIGDPTPQCSGDIRHMRPPIGTCARVRGVAQNRDHASISCRHFWNTSPVGGSLNCVADGVRKRHLRYLVRAIRALRRPVAKARLKPVGDELIPVGSR